MTLKPVYSTTPDTLTSFSLLEETLNYVAVRGLEQGPGIELKLLDVDGNTGTTEKKVLVSLKNGGLTLFHNGNLIGNTITGINYTGDGVSIIPGNPVEINLDKTVVQNVGTGFGLVSGIYGNLISLKTLTEGSGVDINETPTEININAKLNKTYSVVVITTPTYNVTKNNHIMIVKQVSNTVTDIYLPPGSDNQTFTFKDGNGDSDLYNINIHTTNGQLIDSSTVYTISVPFESITIVWNGSDWNII